jgi:outer membrane protein assembly factor BamB
MARTMSALRTYLAGALAVLVVASAVPAGDVSTSQWLQWRGPERAARSTFTGLQTDWNARPPELVWMGEGMGGGFASVSMADGRLYTTGNVNDAQAVIAVSAADGKVIWSTPITSTVPKHGHGGSRCTPSIDGDRVYAISSDPGAGEVVCLKALDGAIVWKRSLNEFGGKSMSGWGFAESPLIDGPWLLCTPGNAPAVMVALDKLTGEEVWRSTAGDLGKKGRDGAGYSSIVVSHGGGVKQYVQLAGRGLIGVRASDGQFLWSYNNVANGTANIPTPIVDGDYVFTSTGYQTGSALVKLSADGQADGQGVKAEEVYFMAANVFQNHHGGMVKVDRYIYAGHGHNNGFPICVELETGKVAWGGNERGPGSGSAAVLYVDGHLIYRYQSGDVALIEATPESYKLKGSFKPKHVQGPSWSHPVVVDGRLYLREQDKLMCYDVSK